MALDLVAAATSEPREPGRASCPSGASAGVLAVDRVEHQVEQLGLAGHVAVERHRADAETLGDPAHRRRVEPFGVGELDRRGDDPLDGQAGLRAALVALAAAPEELEADLEIACHRFGILTAYGVLVMAYSVPGLAIEAIGLRKRYGSTVALDGFDLAVPEGTVCGLLGPNGAGKTTAVRIFATLLRLDEGVARVAGLDVASQAARSAVPDRADGQNDAVDEILTGRQNLEMFGRLFHLSPRAARRRADELLERFGLAEVARKPAKTYSGGMRRRLDLAASFILAPRVLFLDEPTTGQDPRNRNEVWDAMRSFVAEGTTVLLTTHYLDEADQLADQISVIDRGRVIADGTPAELKARVGGSQIDVVVAADALPAAAAAVERVCGSTIRGRATGAGSPAPRTSRSATLERGAARAGRARASTAEDVALRRPTLDEVFLSLTDEAVAA